MLRCVECQTNFTSPHFNTSQSAIHCFEFCFSSEARLTYTLIFLLLPIIFYLTEFLTLTDRSYCSNYSLLTPDLPGTR